MLFSSSFNSWFRCSLTSFCRANSSCCYFLRFTLMSKMIRKTFLILNLRRFFFFQNDYFSFMKKRFRFYKFATTNLKISRIVCDFFAKYNLILMRRVKSIFFSFLFLLCNSKFTRCVHDFHIRRIFCVCRWCWNRNRSCNVFSRMCRIQ
jgi:hypothetical protein